MNELIELFLAFLKIGGTTFGGGLSMLPVLEQEMVDKKGWATHEEVLDYYAIGQCTPGVIAINVSTFIGFKRKGVLGGIVATSGMVTIPFIVILIIAMFLKNFADISAVQSAFAGIRVAVAALVLNAVIRMYKSVVKDYLGIAFCIAAFIAAVLGVSPVMIVLVIGILGVIMSLLKGSQRL